MNEEKKGQNNVAEFLVIELTKSLVGVTPVVAVPLAVALHPPASTVYGDGGVDVTA